MAVASLPPPGSSFNEKMLDRVYDKDGQPRAPANGLNHIMARTLRNW